MLSDYRIPLEPRAARTRQLWLPAFMLVCAFPCSTFAQSDRPSTDSYKPVFAVASVKQNRSNGRAESNVPLDRSDAGGHVGGTFSAVNQPLIAYLIFAYKVGVTETYGGLMSRLPTWATQDRFDIVAKSDAPNPSKNNLRLMLQSLLEERFHLAVHHELREGPSSLLPWQTPQKLVRSFSLTILTPPVRTPIPRRQQRPRPSANGPPAAATVTRCDRRATLTTSSPAVAI